MSDVTEYSPPQRFSVTSAHGSFYFAGFILIPFFPSTELQEEAGTENRLNFFDMQSNFILQIEDVQVKS